MKSTPPYKTIGRLSQYRRLLGWRLDAGKDHVYSHELAKFAGVTAAQVRRDLMAVGATGSPTKGYDVTVLIERLGQELDDPAGQRAALIGIGNLGRAILTYFHGRRPKLSIVAAFDKDLSKTGRVICGCRTYPVDQIRDVVQNERISVGIIAVPITVAQAVADQLEVAGIRGILNFAPMPLRIGPETFVEDIDMTMALERVAYFARQNQVG